MPEWTQGYGMDVPTNKTVFSELSPASINFSLALSGQAAPNLEKPFTYAELGSGFGLSTAAWAAQYPEGQFFAIDVNPSQSAWATRLAAAAELSNLTVYERSIRQMLDENLPKLDYVILNNTCSRVSEDVLADIQAFIQKFLKPGGVVYAGYAALPGCAVAEPLRHLVQEGTRATGEKDPVIALTQGLNFLKELEDSGAVYFTASANAGAWLENWRNSELGFLLGDFFGGRAKAFHFSDMLSRMSASKLAFVGSLDATNYLEPLITPPDFMKRLEQVNASLPLRETVKDMLYNTVYRRDLFVKGPQPLTPEKARKALGKMRLVLAGVRNALPENLVLKGVQVSLREDVYNPIMDILAEAPATIDEMVERLKLDFTQVAQAAVVMTVLGWVQPTPPGKADVRAARVKTFNAALDELLDNEQFAFLLTVNGAWQHCGFLERLYGLGLVKGEDPGAYIGTVMETRGFQVSQDGNPVEDAEAINKIVAEQTALLSNVLPDVLKRLGLV
ncbi:methyltransferase regulatory domain-containing protein [Phaeovibrio sulfidiphilus]|uniref:Methyltransferase regulatory domain-containing protein n=1 Tax=Phaeovibrio sulfidiphilus TaxID=1220600 RepID=A0A8J6YP77_9PROT|nr:methyltransferase regulatory domain-containing protein [Phaeovibrio sulfidiphilus]MBE1236652.1 methyltransferase regulatory domain-containing protein [Phaeovibrio sulfidiphilus]